MIPLLLALLVGGVYGGEEPTKAAKPVPARKKAKASAKLPPLLKEVEKAYSKQKTVQANFSKQEFSSLTKEKRKSSGLLWIQRPNKVRWDTRWPQDSKNLLVSDGKQFWFYTPPFDEEDNGQVIIRKAKDAKSELASVLLTGAFSKARFASITPKGQRSFEITPRRGTSGTVTKALIEVDQKTKLIKRVKITHRDGNEADISLSNFVLGSKFSNTWFQFKVPPKTDVLRN